MSSLQCVNKLAVQVSKYFVTRNIQQNSSHFLNSELLLLQPFFQIEEPKKLYAYLMNHEKNAPNFDQTYSKVVDRLIAKSKHQRQKNTENKASTKGTTQQQQQQQETVQKIKMTIIKEGDKLKGTFSK